LKLAIKYLADKVSLQQDCKETLSANFIRPQKDCMSAFVSQNFCPRPGRGQSCKNFLCMWFDHHA